MIWRPLEQMALCGRPSLNTVMATIVAGLVIGLCAAQPADYTDQWAVQINGGPQEADRIAQRHGFINLGQVVGDYYHFQHRKVAKRSADPSLDHHAKLTSEPQVTWASQQVVKKRVKRDDVDTLSTAPQRPDRARERRPLRRANVRQRSVTVTLNDPRWPQMWYLNRGPSLDMNVQEAWAEGVSGKGVVVTILDDGLEKDHPDIRLNYDPQASYDVNSNDDDPMPRYDLIDSNRHGTRCAGEVAAEGNNSICAVGIAFNAGIGGVRMLDGDVTDAVEARSLSLNPQHIDIYSASWGPDDDGKTVDGPGELATRAFIEGVTKGRGGKGSIFVWASGNGGRDHDNCNCDGYTNSIWTLSISSATENGYVPWYSEACSSTLATTYSSGSSGERQIVTTDLHHSCTASHTGTSASAPLAAAICALALEVNRQLTWRDMQHIVVRTAKPANLKADDWQINGVGRNVSHSFGYGLMDAAAMVRLARNWVTVPPQQHCELRAPDSNKLIPAKSQVSIQLYVSDCPGVNFMEHVQARITLAAVSRGDLQIMLSSPAGTRSTLLTLRPHDTSRNGFHSWPFMSVHFWGENPVGVWTLEIHNEGRYLATLSEWNVVIHGTKESPNSANPSSGESKQPSIPSAIASPEKNNLNLNLTDLDWLDQSVDRKPSLHNNNLNEDRASSALQSPDAPPSPPSSSSSSSVPAPPAVASAAVEIPHCKPGHWDSSAIACLMCENGYYLWQGRCVVTCPLTTRVDNKTSLVGDMARVCVPCHYSCLTCDGPSDTHCTSCHPDSQFRVVHTPGSTTGDERFCQPTNLASQLLNYERWSLGIELALALNVALVIGLLVFVVCNKRGCGSSCTADCCSRQSSSKYEKMGVSFQNSKARVASLTNSSDDEI